MKLAWTYKCKACGQDKEEWVEIEGNDLPEVVKNLVGNMGRVTIEKRD